MDTDFYTVHVGSSHKQSDGSIIKVKMNIHHNFYNSYTSDFDIALIELVEALKFTDKIQPIALPSGNTLIEDGTLGLVTGWGKTKSIKTQNFYLHQKSFFFSSNSRYTKIK